MDGHPCSLSRSSVYKPEESSMTHLDRTMGVPVSLESPRVQAGQEGRLA